MDADEDEAMGTDENCFNCQFYLGPIVAVCACPESEFAKCYVHPAGWCPEFKITTDM